MQGIGPNASLPEMDKPKPRFTTARLKKRPARYNGKHPGGRPTAYGPKIADKICALIASGDTLRAACVNLKIPEDTVYGWLVSYPEFHQNYASPQTASPSPARGADPIASVK